MNKITKFNFYNNLNEEVLFVKIIDVQNSLTNAGFNVSYQARYGNNILCVSKNGKEIIKLYVKICNAKKPIWGLTKNRLDLLNENENNYVVILTYLTDCYIYHREQVTQLIKSASLGGGGDYKITEKQNFSKESFEDLINELQLLVSVK